MRLRRPRARGLGKRAWLLTWTIRLMLWTLGFTRIIRTEIVNADIVPDRGAVILAANHTSMVDVFFILGCQRSLTWLRRRPSLPRACGPLR